MKMDVTAFVVLILVVMLAGSLPYGIKSFVYNRVYKEIQKKNFDKAIERLNEKIYTVLFGKYDRDLMLLRIYIATQDYKKCEAHIMEMMTGNLSGNQSYQAASMAYYFFLDAENKDVCRFLLPFLNKKKHEDEYAFASCLYRVIIEKKSEDIESNKIVLERLIAEKKNEKQKEKKKENEEDAQEENTEQIGLYQYLIGLQYMYMKKHKDAKEYFNKARINLKGTPYHRKINALINQCK